jgi:hypothetical protein
MSTPEQILEKAMGQAQMAVHPLIGDEVILARLESVCEEPRNRSGARVLLACALAKLDRPDIDIRKPYTEIGGSDTYSGRTYDEQFVTAFFDAHDLPLNNTTAWLTPAWRTNSAVLTRGIDLGGRPSEMYRSTVSLLNDVYEGTIEADQLLTETIRHLIGIRDRQNTQLNTLYEELRRISHAVTIPLSGEDVITLIEQHLKSKNASRLPVLVVAAAYKAAQAHLQECILPLRSHTAADRQTGSLGDVEITLLNDEGVVTNYEMKDKPVTINDINHAVQKIRETGRRVDNYIFVTTESTEREVHEYARSIYESTGGIEIVILDCIAFVRHFIHLFHRLRIQYLDAYQELLLAEPDSAVSAPLKQIFLALRINAQSSFSEE